MLGKQRKKHTSSNINININLKVQSKQAPAGRKITQLKEIQKNNQSLRPNQVYKQKKHSGQETNPTKQSIQQFLQDHPLQHSKEENNYHHINRNQKTERPPKTLKTTSRKRGKSKSLGNLKVRYYARTPEPLSKSNSKMSSKSKSKSKITSKSKSKSKKKKTEEKLALSPGSFLHSETKKSKSKSKPKSKSPLISKKRSLQTFRVSSRELEKQKQKQKQKLWSKNLTTFKKSQPSQPSFDKGAKIGSKINNKPLEKPKSRKSKEKLKPASPPKKNPQIISQKPKSKKFKNHKPEKIFPPSYLNTMATKIQKAWRGYIVRKKFREELNEITSKIKTIKKEQIWESHSNHSIIQLDSDFGGEKKERNMSQRSNSESMVPQFMLELQNLRKKFEEQEDRFKILTEENSQLKANLSKINSEHLSASNQKKEKKPEKLLVFNQNVISMRIQSQQSDLENQDERASEKRIDSAKRRREKMLELEAAIKTEESKQQASFSDLKKKIEHFECSPRNQDSSIFRFNKTLIKKLFTEQEEKLNEKYFKKNKDYKTLLQNELISPKSYSQRCSEWQFKLKKEKEDTIKKYKEAEKAMLLVAELQHQDEPSEIRLKQNEERNRKIQGQGSPSFTHKRSHESSEHSTPEKKTINLFLNVDEIDENHEKYPPIISHNSYRQHEIQLEREADLSELYQQVMQDHRPSKNSNIYLHGEDEKEEKMQMVQNHPEIGDKCEKKEEKGNTQMEIAQYPEFKIEYLNKQRKISPFETNLKYIRIFYIKFCQFFRQVPRYKEEILANISQEVIFDPQIYLRSLRAHKEEDEAEEESQLIFPYFKFIGTYNNAIPVQMLNAFYSELINPDSEQLYSKQVYQMKKTSHEEYRELGYSAYELKQYYDLALIDAFNQAINYERPGGAEASNLDNLTHQYRSINKERIKSKISARLPEEERENNLNLILGNTIGRIVNIWACSLCGFINDCTQEEEEKIDEGKLQEIRTHRLTLYLEKSLVQDEQTMTNIKPFQLFIKVELTNRILHELVEELIRSIHGFRNKT